MTVSGEVYTIITIESRSIKLRFNTRGDLGAGDSYFAAFLCSLLKSSKRGALLEGTEEENAAHLQEAMQVGAAFAAKMCAKEGAFGYGTPIVGRTEL